MRNFRKAQLKQKRRQNRKRKGKIVKRHEEQIRQRESFVSMIASAMKKAKEAIDKKIEAKEMHDNEKRVGVSVLKTGDFIKKKNGETHIYRYEKWGGGEIMRVLVA